MYTTPAASIGTTPATPVKPVILLTNDDGVCPESAMILQLAQWLVTRGHDVVVVAPSRNNSACGQRISLSKNLSLRRHCDFEQRFAPADAACSVESPGELLVFSLDDGSPADCVIVATEPRTGLLARLERRARVVLSGINVGQNLGNDVLYSGTFAAARQAAMYGFPSVALSLDLYTGTPNAEVHRADVSKACRAAHAVLTTVLAELPEELPDVGRFRAMEQGASQRHKEVLSDPQAALVDACGKGDVTLNVNIPVKWDGTFMPTSLDCSLYRSVVDVGSVPSGVKGADDEVVSFSYTGTCINTLHPGSDVQLIRKSNTASITPVSTWPIMHPFALPEKFFTDVLDPRLAFWKHLKHV